jgi:sigma-B regulation protein RsbU (phosphoserine phosphatase)
VDITKQKEQEHMLDSFAKLADRNKIQLEKVNQALSQKTEELQEAVDVIKAQKNRMSRELEVARQVQMNMLPRDFVPNHKECTVAGTVRPALEVGGDFFDFFYVDTNRLCFLVGDVSDKGAASGLFMAAAKTLIKAHAVRAESTAGIVSRVNRELSVNNDSCMFVTLLLAILDLSTGEVVLTNGGHNRPYRIRQGQEPESIRELSGPALGIVEAADYSEATIVLEPGDLMVVYSDGVTEAMSRKRELFGEDRLERLLALNSMTTAEVVGRTIADAVAAFEEDSQQSDDVTVVAVKFHGP